MKKQMKELNLNYSCLVAFSGTVKHSGMDYTENSLNELPSGVGIPEEVYSKVVDEDLSRKRAYPYF